MKNIFFFFLLFVASKSVAQDTITTAQVKDYIGRDVWVKGKVAAIKAASEENHFNYINVDKAFPQNIFTVIVADNYIKRMKIDLSKSKGKTILVKGKIEAKGTDTPQILNPSKIQVK